MQLLSGGEPISRAGALPVCHTLPLWASCAHGCVHVYTRSASLALGISHKPHPPSRRQIQEAGG